MQKESNHYELVSLCDLNQKRLSFGKDTFNVKEDNCFTSEDAFFKEKRGDLLVVSTQDRDHVGHAIKGLKLGYDILLEKPISGDKEEILSLIEAQKKYNHKIFVCHVLRYAPAFTKVKELIEGGTVGELVMIDAIENVEYRHQSHSYVRGNWRDSKVASPMILAKCCHDLDLLVWYANSPCDTLSSIGDLRHFKKENQPLGASNRCKDCNYKGACLFDAYKIYIEQQFWGRAMISDERPITDETLKSALDNGPYGRCVYDCDNNVVDNEITVIKFKNGVTANLRMTGFTAHAGRIMKFYGTRGQIDLDEMSGYITVMPFGQKDQRIEISSLIEGVNGHGGGDDGLIHSLYENLISTKEGSTTLAVSVESHLMAFAAEESRLNNGSSFKIH
jgi:predicted dehydrogenase